MKADLIVVGRIFTGEERFAEAVAVVGDRIAAVGEERAIFQWRDRRTEVFAIPGAAVLPGFVDAHLHFLAFARRRMEVDCSAARAASVGELLAHLREAAAAVPPGCWLRAFGYDEALLEEHRPPTVAELDLAAPAHPVRLLHRTGHAAVLNTLALQRLGMPPIDVLYEPAERLRGRIPALAAAELTPLAAEASRQLLAAGVTTFHDPTPGQDGEALRTLRHWSADGTVEQRVVAYGDRHAFAAAVVHADRFRNAGVKIVVTDASDAGEVAERVRSADAAGAQIAVHAVEGGALVMAIAALGGLGSKRVRQRRHRIEHAALCPPALRTAVAECGATVVTHPDFLALFGEKYRAEMSAQELDWLYPLRGWLADGVPVALGSDAPIGVPAPLANVASAVARGAGNRAALGASQAITPAEAIRLHTAGGAAAAGLDGGLGSIAPNRIADLVILAADPTRVPAADIASIPVRATIVGGRVAWRA